MYLDFFSSKYIALALFPRQSLIEEVSRAVLATRITTYLHSL